MNTTDSKDKDRCEVCARVIGTRANPRKRRCRAHVDVSPLFPLSACRGRRRGGGRR
ncbi:hypothetical protein [Prauserella shujinwangii]|uniref:hypothetical protein n=1 Tax=Prauserella shujinwangii TaxID=1453103 RepID=UPI0015E5A346|nr:hypothetical protein [Prauserella shujinwangii]